jgi:acyl carrier protein
MDIMNNKNPEIEKKIREFLVNDMIKEEVKNASTTDQIDFDSLDQTELRVFLEEEFGIDFSERAEIAPLTTIQSIIDCVVQSAIVER